MPILTKNCLSEHDQRVLDSIFNPLQIGGGAELEKWDVTECEEVEDEVPELGEISAQEKEAIEIELEAITAAEMGEYQKAVDLFSRSIELAPNRAQAFNNRAQANRLLGNSDDLVFCDLKRSLELSNGKGRTGRQAFCQRGILYRKISKDDDAREDFKSAADLGSKFAKNQLIELNPYAALCNQMLREAFTKIG